MFTLPPLTREDMDSWEAPTRDPLGKRDIVRVPQGIQLFGGPCDGMVVTWSLGYEIHVYNKIDRISVYEYRYTHSGEYIGAYKESRFNT